MGRCPGEPGFDISQLTVAFNYKSPFSNTVAANVNSVNVGCPSGQVRFASGGCGPPSDVKVDQKAISGNLWSPFSNAVAGNVNNLNINGGPNPGCGSGFEMREGHCQPVKIDNKQNALAANIGGIGNLASASNNADTNVNSGSCQEGYVRHADGRCQPTDLKLSQNAAAVNVGGVNNQAIANNEAIFNGGAGSITENSLATTVGGKDSLATANTKGIVGFDP